MLLDSSFSTPQVAMADVNKSTGTEFQRYASVADNEVYLKEYEAWTAFAYCHTNSPDQASHFMGYTAYAPEQISC